jgi:hypothetical protein
VTWVSKLTVTNTIIILEIIMSLLDINNDTSDWKAEEMMEAIVILLARKNRKAARIAKARKAKRDLPIQTVKKWFRLCAEELALKILLAMQCPGVNLDSTQRGLRQWSVIEMRRRTEEYVEALQESVDNYQRQNGRVYMRYLYLFAKYNQVSSNI